MSNIISSLVQQKRTGSAVKKSVLSYMADKAADDGSGIWTSKANMARDLELSRRSVQKAISEMESDGIIREIGKRSCGNGFTVEYQIIVSAVHALQSTREVEVQDGGETTRAPGSHVNEVHVTRAPGSHQDVNHVHPNHPLTIHEPSIGACEDDLFSAEDAPKVDPFEGILDRFYEVYPKRKDKKHSTPAAIRPVLKVALKKASAEELIRCATNYANSDDHKDGEFALKAEKWLKNEEWVKHTEPPKSDEDPNVRWLRETRMRNEEINRRIAAGEEF